MSTRCECRNAQEKAQKATWAKCCKGQGTTGVCISRRERQVGLLEYDETRDGMFDGKSLIYGILPLMFDKVRGELVSTHNSHTPSNLSNSLTDIVLIFSILYRMQWKHCTMHQSSNFHHDGSESQILTSRHYH